MRRTVLTMATLVALVALVWPELQRLARQPSASDAREPSTSTPVGPRSQPRRPKMPAISADRPLPGEVYEVRLAEPPATRYAAGKMTEADHAYAGLLDRSDYPKVQYDPNLGHAARELAYHHSILEGLVPQELVDFLLRAAGAVDRQVTQAFMSTTGSGLEAVRERLASMLAAVPRTQEVRVGVGEVYASGARPIHYIAVLLSHREIRVKPTPRRVAPGATWRLSGRLPAGYTAPSALVLRPGGGLEAVKVRDRRGRFSVTLDVGQELGTVHVSVGAVGPSGPKPLVQVPVVVGDALPTTLQLRLPPDEAHLKSAAAAERLALRLLNADRRHHGLPALERDPDLDAIARGHSVDMRDRRFFGHVSPTTGGPDDRVRAARYRASTHAENVAKGGSIHGAERGLLKSLGHRRNILNPDFTHVGIGVARKMNKGRVDWHLTQLFAKPVVRIDAAAQEVKITDRLNAARRKVGARAMRADLRLSRVARRAEHERRPRRRRARSRDRPLAASRGLLHVRRPGSRRRSRYRDRRRHDTADVSCTRRR